MTAFNKVWLGTTDSSYTTASNWQAISVRTSAYSWTASGGGTNEYYLRTSGGADPGLGGTPGEVYINGTLATVGTAGTLAAGRWAYGDNDTLGYSTIYVRLSDGTDPDSKSRDYVTFKQIPYAADKVTISGSATTGPAGSDQTAVAIGSFYIEPGFRNLAIGSRDTPLRIDPDTFVSEGSGTAAWYIDLYTAAIAPEVRNCPSPTGGIYGLYLTGSALTTIVHDKGSLAVAALPGDTTTVATVNVRAAGAAMLLSENVTLTTLRHFAGSTVVRCSGTTVEATGGSLTAELAAAFTNVNIEGAAVYDKSTGTWATVTLDAGTLDTMGLPASKTYTAMKHNAGTFKENTDLLTITTRNEPDYAGTCSRGRAA